jgi:hypothetical protein
LRRLTFAFTSSETTPCRSRERGRTTMAGIGDTLHVQTPRWGFMQYRQDGKCLGFVQLTMNGLSRVLGRMFREGDTDYLLAVGPAKDIWGEAPILGRDR